MITQQERDDIRTRLDTFHQWLGKRTSYKPEEIPPHIPTVSNEERSALEVFDFINEPPQKYFLYIRETTHVAVTWMGEVLGKVFFGSPYRSNMGDTRVPVRINAINGKTYSGTYFKSSGDYARIKLVKS